MAVWINSNKTTEINKTMNVKKYNADCYYGNTGEAQIASALQRHFDTDFSRTSRYNGLDFISEDKKIQIEVKRRRNSSTQYATTLIGQNKITNMLDSCKDGIKSFCCFMFTDGYFIIEITPENMENIEQSQKGGRSDRNTNEFKPEGYAYIPVNILTKMEN